MMQWDCFHFLCRVDSLSPLWMQIKFKPPPLGTEALCKKKNKKTQPIFSLPVSIPAEYLWSNTPNNGQALMKGLASIFYHDPVFVKDIIWSCLDEDLNSFSRGHIINCMSWGGGSNMLLNARDAPSKYAKTHLRTSGLPKWAKRGPSQLPVRFWNLKIGPLLRKIRPKCLRRWDSGCGSLSLMGFAYLCLLSCGHPCLHLLVLNVIPPPPLCHDLEVTPSCNFCPLSLAAWKNKTKTNRCVPSKIPHF